MTLCGIPTLFCLCVKLLMVEKERDRGTLRPRKFLSECREIEIRVYSDQCPVLANSNHSMRCLRCFAPGHFFFNHVRHVCPSYCFCRSFFKNLLWNPKEHELLLLVTKRNGIHKLVDVASLTGKNHTHSRVPWRHMLLCKMPHACRVVLCDGLKPVTIFASCDCQSTEERNDHKQHCCHHNITLSRQHKVGLVVHS